MARLIRSLTMSAILSPARREVKRTLNTARRPGRFGDGILDRRMPYTAADVAWASYELNKDSTDYDIVLDFDRLAGESWALDRLERGCCLRGLARAGGSVSRPPLSKGRRAMASLRKRGQSWY